MLDDNSKNWKLDLKEHITKKYPEFKEVGIPSYKEMRTKPVDVFTAVSNDIMEHIIKANREADRRMIEANMIIIDQDLAIANNLYKTFQKGSDDYITHQYPPMILGLEVKYDKNLTRDYGFNFIISRGEPTKNRIEELEAENARLKEQLRKIKEVMGLD